MLVQIDGSPHAWLGDRGPRLCLISRLREHRGMDWRSATVSRSRRSQSAVGWSTLLIRREPSGQSFETFGVSRHVCTKFSKPAENTFLCEACDRGYRLFRLHLLYLGPLLGEQKYRIAKSRPEQDRRIDGRWIAWLGAGPWVR